MRGGGSRRISPSCGSLAQQLLTPQLIRQSRNRRLPAYGRLGCRRSRRVSAARIRLEPHGGAAGERQMDGVKALVVLASVYYPGDGIVAENNYQTSSGERYDQSTPKCAALQWPLGTMLHLVHGRNNIDVTINDHGPYRKRPGTGLHASGRQGLAPGRFRLGTCRTLSAIAEGAASRGGGRRRG